MCANFGQYCGAEAAGISNKPPDFVILTNKTLNSFGRDVCRFSRNIDTDGRGTAVAGLIGGNQVRVATKAELVGVKVNCDGYPWDYGLVDAINWVVKEHKKPKQWPWDPIPARRTVLAAAYGRIASKSASDALDAAVDEGIFVLNPYLSLNECSSIPKRSFIVSGSNILDKRSSVSNVDECVDIFAPGEDILTAVIQSDNSYAYWTSETVPVGFVAGAVAAIWSGLPANTTVAELKDIVRQRAAEGVLTEIRNSPNRLLNL